MLEQNATLTLQMAASASVMERGRNALGGPAKNLLHNAEIRRGYLGG
jgi:branched-chain amino acid transport system ATP-binding protein